jgi:hypothetical protein
MWTASPRTRRARRILSVMLVPIQLTVPNRMKGQTTSIVYCGVNLVPALGPPWSTSSMNAFMEAAQRSACAWPP